MSKVNATKYLFRFANKFFFFGLGGGVGGVSRASRLLQLVKQFMSASKLVEKNVEIYILSGRDPNTTKHDTCSFANVFHLSVGCVSWSHIG